MKKIILAILLILCFGSNTFATTTDFNMYAKGTVGYKEESSWHNYSGAIFESSTGYLRNYQSNTGGIYNEYCGLIKFDTSSIPASATIVSATIKLKHTGSDTDQTVNMGYYTWNGDVTSTQFIDQQTATAASFSFASTWNYHAITLSNVSSITKAGYTSFRLRLESTTPSLNTYYGGYFDTSTDIPVLSVTYTTGYSKKINGVTSAAKVLGVTPVKVNGL